MLHTLDMWHGSKDLGKKIHAVSFVMAMKLYLLKNRRNNSITTLSLIRFGHQ